MKSVADVPDSQSNIQDNLPVVAISGETSWIKASRDNFIKIFDYVEKNLDQNLMLTKLSKVVGSSPNYFASLSPITNKSTLIGLIFSLGIIFI